MDINVMMHKRSKLIEIRGVVSSGVGRSMMFTELPWVKRQFAQKLGIVAYPGTFNVTVLREDRGKLQTVKDSEGIEILSEDANHCNGKGFLAKVNDEIEGAVIVPQVLRYPEGQLEIISSKHIKKSLGLKDGDPVDVVVCL
jgi:riboflavin kinase